MLKLKWNLILVIGALVGTSAFAVQAAAAEEHSASHPLFHIRKASDLIGKAVENPRGERLGEVEDLVIDGEHGRVAYAVLSLGEFLGKTDKWFAVPTGALTLPKNCDCEHFVLTVEMDRLSTAPGFDKDRWPNLGDSDWGANIHEFYGQRPYWMDEGESDAPTNRRIQKASEIIGRRIHNERGEKLGEIKDLVIDADRYRVAYVVLRFGGFLGLGEKLFALPAGVLQPPGAGAYAVLTVNKKYLKTARGFDKNNWPNRADPTLAVKTDEVYGQRRHKLEDLYGGRYLTSAAGATCHECGRIAGPRGFVRDSEAYCCAGCANKTVCTCSAVADKSHP